MKKNQICSIFHDSLVRDRLSPYHFDRSSTMQHHQSLLNQAPHEPARFPLFLHILYKIPIKIFTTQIIFNPRYLHNHVVSYIHSIYIKCSQYLYASIVIIKFSFVLSHKELCLLFPISTFCTTQMTV